MKTAPVLRVLGLLTLVSGALGFQSYGVVGVIVSIVTSAWFFAGAEALTYLHAIAEQTKHSVTPPAQRPIMSSPLSTSDELKDSIRAMQSARDL